MGYHPAFDIHYLLLPYVLAAYKSPESAQLIEACHIAKLVLLFYRQSKDIDKFLRTNTSISRTNYLRLILLSSIAILFTFL